MRKDAEGSAREVSLPLLHGALPCVRPHNFNFMHSKMDNQFALPN